ncbi:hypothetical protein TorRG33x02_239360, partial [Trema orientale]
INMLSNVAQNEASTVSKAVSTTEKHIEGELSLFAIFDHKILDLIYATHVHADESFL